MGSETCIGTGAKTLTHSAIGPLDGARFHRRGTMAHGPMILVFPVSSDGGAAWGLENLRSRLRLKLGITRDAIYANPQCPMARDASQYFSAAGWVETGQTHCQTRDILWDRPVFHAPPLIVPRLGVSAEPFTRQGFCASSRHPGSLAPQNAGRRSAPSVLRIWTPKSEARRRNDDRSWRMRLIGAVASAVGL